MGSTAGRAVPENGQITPQHRPPNRAERRRRERALRRAEKAVERSGLGIGPAGDAPPPGSPAKAPAASAPGPEEAPLPEGAPAAPHWVEAEPTPEDLARAKAATEYAGLAPAVLSRVLAWLPYEHELWGGEIPPARLFALFSLELARGALLTLGESRNLRIAMSADTRLLGYTERLDALCARRRPGPSDPDEEAPAAEPPSRYEEMDLLRGIQRWHQVLVQARTPGEVWLVLQAEKGFLRSAGGPETPPEFLAARALPAVRATWRLLRSAHDERLLLANASDVFRALLSFRDWLAPERGTWRRLRAPAVRLRTHVMDPRAERREAESAGERPAQQGVEGAPPMEG